VDGAIDAYREALALDRKYTKARYNLGQALSAKGDADGAIDAYREALAFDPNFIGAHISLGAILGGVKHEYDRAIFHYRKALDLDPKSAPAHYNLGNALWAKGEMDGVIAAFRQAIAIDPKYAEAHCNLGQALRQRGEFADALAALKRGHELGSQQKGWRYPSKQWVQQCERLVELDSRLPDVLKGKARLRDAGERIEFAEICSAKRLNAASARLYADAFTADAKRADNLRAGYRYKAACAAALAASGQGADAAKLDDTERRRRRQQALGWLRADLTLWAKRLASGRPADRAQVQEALRYWQGDPDLAGLRDRATVAKLPAEEQKGCRKLWAEVKALLAKARALK
jgi:tetratricopeptide (TPR) repeat protein